MAAEVAVEVVAVVAKVAVVVCLGTMLEVLTALWVLRLMLCVDKRGYKCMAQWAGSLQVWLVRCHARALGG